MGDAIADKIMKQWFAFRQDYDLLILDWMLPKISRLIKSANHT
jgi:two-component system, OmpR family, manganese sensing response regulator